nr:hypothetical protein [Candidatus Sigynarchaeota archaeon]
ALSKRKFMLVALAIGLGMGILTILYINNWRPYIGDAVYGVTVAWDATAFTLFQFLILLMEIIAFAPFLIGFIIEVVKIAQE